MRLHSSADFHGDFVTVKLLDIAMTSTVQHYVPQFLLKGFSHSKRKLIYAFDKKDGRVFRQSTRRVACERGFYETDDDNAMDAWIGKIEGTVAPIIQRVCNSRSLTVLSAEDRIWVSVFTASQILRTPNYREKWGDMNRQMTDAFTQMGADPYKIRNFRPMTDAEARDSTISVIPSLTRDLSPAILDKAWLLLEPGENQTFWISDNPVVMANSTNPGDGIRGTIGLGVEGIEVYLPISHSLILGFFCRTIEEMITNQISTAAMFDLALPRRTGDLSVGFREQIPVRIDFENVIFQNSLQVAGAERYVFSPYNDFSLAEDMLDTNPHLKCGARLGIVGRDKRSASKHVGTKPETR